MAPTKQLRKRIHRWGDSYGIRFTRAELDELGLGDGDDVDVSLDPSGVEIDWDALPRSASSPEADRGPAEIVREGLRG